ncbi:MAG: fibronectin type III-like domain-contianing protein, partial [Clostridia bacterium]|nr:fibronectin type III-like domain-contianing protein [Clostridia bacterium]
EELKAGKRLTVSVNISNVGNFDGKETVQLYIHDKVASIIRPIRELKNYKKILIKKGETARVELTVGYDQLGFYDGSGDYTVEPGDFEIYVGESCLTENRVDILVTK